jgi:uncharacterized membrane protein
MVLHFPIALVVAWSLLVIFFLNRRDNRSEMVNVTAWLMLVAAFTAALTALMGLFLSRETGYDAESLFWHKWSGAAISILLLLCYYFRDKIFRLRFLSITMASLSLVTIVFAGHQGAGITHGQNFLLAPILPEKKQVRPLLEDAEVFSHLVRPILEEKCMGCHNSKKAKGELVMESQDLLVKGGKDGKLWDSTQADFGLMMRRIHLPLESRKHMPPQGKPQLTQDEITIIQGWLQHGADFKLKLVELPATDPLRKIGEGLFTSPETEEYDFAAAPESKISSLNTNYRIVYPLARKSPALGAEFFSPAQFSSKNLEELLAVKQQLVYLNLDKMPVHDEDLATIAAFTQLRKLNLSFTEITDAGLHQLQSLRQLKQLSLSGTKVTAGSIRQLVSLKQLSKLFIWNTGIKPGDLDRKGNPNLVIETGFRSDTIILKLTPPILQNEERIVTKPLAVRLKHYVNGVAIRYSLNGQPPDSLESPVYKDSLVITGNAQLKAIAYKPGWYSSDTTTAEFFVAAHQPDALIHLLPPDNSYKDEKGGILIDLVKGDRNFRSGKWVGFRNNSMAALLVFSQPVTLDTVFVSSLVDIGSYLMPPASLEVWAGNDSGHLRLLNRISPPQPGKTEPSYLKIYGLGFKPFTARYFKVVANPVLKLPRWHPGKGERGWFFVDEIFAR